MMLPACLLPLSAATPLPASHASALARSAHRHEVANFRRGSCACALIKSGRHRSNFHCAISASNTPNRTGHGAVLVLIRRESRKARAQRCTANSRWERYPSVAWKPWGFGPHCCRCCASPHPHCPQPTCDTAAGVGKFTSYLELEPAPTGWIISYSLNERSERI